MEAQQLRITIHACATIVTFADASYITTRYYSGSRYSIDLYAHRLN